MNKSNKTIEEFVLGQIAGFIGDPPDSDYQQGYLAALVNVAGEGLGFMNAIKNAEELLSRRRRHEIGLRVVVTGEPQS